MNLSAKSKRSLIRRAAKAKARFAAFQDAEGQWLRQQRDALLMFAYRFGAECESIKAKIGRGNWPTFLYANFKYCGRTETTIRKNVERCMKLFRNNPNCKKASQLSIESVRKFTWNYVVKERPVLAGDMKISPSPHYLTTINDFDKWHRQVQIGRIKLPSRETLRHGFGQMIKRISELCGRDYVLRCDHYAAN